jgi:hypothetical protein
MWELRRNIPLYALAKKSISTYLLLPHRRCNRSAAAAFLLYGSTSSRTLSQANNNKKPEREKTKRRIVRGGGWFASLLSCVRDVVFLCDAKPTFLRGRGWFMARRTLARERKMYLWPAQTLLLPPVAERKMRLLR